MLVFFLPTIALAKPIIKYDRQSFDPLKGIYYLEGNVSVQTGGRLITADAAQVELYSLQVHAQGNITLTQGNLVFTGDEVNVYGKDKLAVVSGDITFSDGTVSLTATTGNFNWGTKDAVFDGNVLIDADDSAFTGGTAYLTQRRNTYGQIAIDEIIYNVRDQIFHS